MTDQSPALRRIQLLKPDTLLDIGCGCGAFTIELSPHCRQITAIDISEALLERCRRENCRPNITYRYMNGQDLDFPDGSFDLVVVRASLHHELQWRQVLDEMLRVTKKEILIEEPFDDPRSDSKRNTMRAQSLFLELQAEVGYPHYEYRTPDELIIHLGERGVQPECEMVKSDKPVTFDYFFEPWEFFANKSHRKDYWQQRLSHFRRELGDGQLCENDIIFIAGRK